LFDLFSPYARVQGQPDVYYDYSKRVASWMPQRRKLL
jgi:hypothetical protein